jgi:hypothetical protein
MGRLGSEVARVVGHSDNSAARGWIRRVRVAWRLARRVGVDH